MQSPPLHTFLSHPSFLTPQPILILFIICVILCLLTRPGLLCPVCVHCKTPQRNLLFLQPQEHPPLTALSPQTHSLQFKAALFSFPMSSVGLLLEQRISSNFAWLPTSDHPCLQKAKSQLVTHRD